MKLRSKKILSSLIVCIGLVSSVLGILADLPELIETYFVAIKISENLYWIAVVFISCTLLIAWIWTREDKAQRDILLAEYATEERPVATALQLQKKEIVGKTFYWFDYVANQESPLVNNVVFRNCTIVGPSVIAFNEGNKFFSCGFGMGLGDIYSIMWVIPKGSYLGATSIRQCNFYECNFQSIGFAMNRSLEKEFLSQVPDVYKTKASRK